MVSLEFFVDVPSVGRGAEVNSRVTSAKIMGEWILIQPVDCWLGPV